MHPQSSAKGKSMLIFTCQVGKYPKMFGKLNLTGKNPMVFASENHEATDSVASYECYSVPLRFSYLKY